MSISLNDYPLENSNWDVEVSLRAFTSGSIFPNHVHQCGQLAYAASGVLSMFTEKGNWVVPSKRALWVPPGVAHEMHMRGDVTMVNTYLTPPAIEQAQLPDDCQVFGVSPLLRHLFSAAMELPAERPDCGRTHHVIGLLVEEIRLMPRLGLSAPLPSDSRLGAACQRFLDNPTQNISTDEMAAWAMLSRRTFTRRFKEHMGMTYLAWRQQMCLLVSITRLGNGEPITRVASDLGFSSPSAFSTIFRRALGQPPSQYLATSRETPVY